MKVIASICAVVVLSGCLTTQKRTRDELCAERGMVVDGVTVWGKDDRGNDLGAVNCGQPRTPEQVCQVEKAKAVAKAREDMDGNAVFKNWAIGFGYMLYVLPGYALYSMWEPEHRPYEDRYWEATRDYNRCAAAAVAH